MTCINIDSLTSVTKIIRTCPSCGHLIKYEEKAGIHNLPGLPAGVKFDPSDQEILEHLEAKREKMGFAILIQKSYQLRIKVHS
ncbi:hypothetical protein KY289_031398 [Solanum tuberosum]|nr:hypothetical protein KY289_031398 [Solanum tuberosum]